MTAPQPEQQRVIQRLARELVEAKLEAANYGALVDQLLEEKQQRHSSDDEV